MIDENLVIQELKSIKRKLLKMMIDNNHYLDVKATDYLFDSLIKEIENIKKLGDCSSIGKNKWLN